MARLRSRFQELNLHQCASAFDQAKDRSHERERVRGSVSLQKKFPSRGSEALRRSSISTSTPANRKIRGLSLKEGELESSWNLVNQPSIPGFWEEEHPDSVKRHRHCDCVVGVGRILKVSQPNLFISDPMLQKPSSKEIFCLTSPVAFPPQ